MVTVIIIIRHHRQCGKGSKLSELISNYNMYMENVFNNNQMLISIVTGVLMSVALGLVYKTPDVLRSIMYRYLLTHIRLDSGNMAYFNIVDRVFEDMEVIKDIGYYSIQSGAWGHGRTILALGSGTRIVRIAGKLCIINVNLEKVEDRFIYTITFYVPKYRGYEFAKWLFDMGNTSRDVAGTYLVSQTISGTNIQHRQTNENPNALVVTTATATVLKHVDNFINNEDFYIKNGLPYKLGLLLDGVPGAGKTSLVRHLASKYNCDVIVVRTLDDLDKLIETAKVLGKNRRVLVLIEEIDLLVPTNRDTEVRKDDLLVGTSDMGGGNLSRALQALDGIVSTPGRLLIGTTNRGDVIDSALIRPGRFDHVVSFDYLTEKEFSMFYMKYYNEDISFYIKQGDKKVIQCTPPMLQQDFLALTKPEFIDKYLN